MRFVSPSGSLGRSRLALLTRSAVAGPPYISDDPEPTDYQHFDIYTFNLGTATRNGTVGQTGIDVNYGAAPDLQLTATLPEGFDRPVGGGRGGVEDPAGMRTRICAR